MRLSLSIRTNSSIISIFVSVWIDEDIHNIRGKETREDACSLLPPIPAHVRLIDGKNRKSGADSKSIKRFLWRQVLFFFFLLRTFYTYVILVRSYF